MPYNMNMNEVLEAAARVTPQWLAGFFDGEGSVVAVKHPNNGVYSFFVHISQKEGKILSLIQFLYGGNMYPLSRRNHKWFMLKWTGKTSIKFLEAIKDHVICKKRQVDAALALAQLITNGGHSHASAVTSSAAEKRAECAKMIVDANNGLNDDAAVQQQEGGVV